ncbi:peptidoglycan-binding protein [Candidatus Kaiserbacteria bacterium]|nr:peptidoglycan-binding protein [Candidatus Kaiserbacteria bacterium]
MKEARNSIIAGFFAAVLIVGASATPASALTIEEIQAQIQSLLSRIANMSGQPAASPATSVVPNPVAKHRVCAALYRNLSHGSRGDDVRALQEFLRAEGYLTANATGYFGPATRAALARWQASQGISAVGSLGPLTRARIVVWCGSGGGVIACTKEYKPVCGRPAICSNSQVGAYPRECDYGQTYTNSCEMSAAGAAFLYEGQCAAPQPTPDPSADQRCRAWYDGCNDCSRQYPGGPAACTLRACLSGQGIWQAPAYCKEYFDVATNRPPTISSFSGPTVLSINQTGSWSVQASDPENGPLSYHVVWGDEQYAAPMASLAAEAFIQTTTFTHSYARAGTYTVIVHVRDSAGQQAETTTTVRVEGAPQYCTMEYAPVCGQKTSCPSCYYSEPACLAPCYTEYRTYSNRCLMNGDGATLVHEGMCQNPPYQP